MNSDVPKSKVVFVVSSWHSGSTWVGYVLGSTPKSAFLGEYHRAWDEAARVPCTLCAARGLTECAVLHGIEQLPAEQAFAIAAERTGKAVLIDNSKLANWTERFTDRPDHDCRLVHVVKDPRGWFVSTRRRGRQDLREAVASWCQENREWRDLVRAAGAHGVTVCYDMLSSPWTWHLRRLFRFCGLRYSGGARRYWRTEHHGFAANGASDAILKAAGAGSVPGHFATADDPYYARRSRRQFRDDRWRSELSPDDEAAIRDDRDVTALMASMGYRLTRSGVAALPGWSRSRLSMQSAPRHAAG